MKLNTKSALYGAAVLTLGNAFTQGVGFAYRILLTRLIDAEGMGLYSLVMSVYSIIMSLVVSGLSVTVSRLTAEYSARGQLGAVSTLFRRAHKLFFGLWAMAALAVFLFSDAVSVYLLGDARTRAGLIVLLFCILLTGVENIHKNHFYGRQRIHQPAFSESLEIVVRAVSVLALLQFLRPDHEEAAIALIITGMTISEVVSVILLRLMYRRQRPRAALSEVSRSQMTRQMQAVIVPTVTANFLTNLIGSAGSIIIPGRLMLSGMSSFEALSSFGVMTGMTLPFLLLPAVFTAALSLVMIPRLTENVARGEMRAARRRAVRTLILLALVLTPVYALLMAFGGPWAAVIYKNAAAGAFIRPLCAAAFIVNFQSILCAILVGLGRHNRVAANNVLSGLLQLCLIWLLTADPRLQMGGYVAALTASAVVGTLLCTFDTVKAFRVDMPTSPGRARGAALIPFLSGRRPPNAGATQKTVPSSRRRRP